MSESRSTHAVIMTSEAKWEITLNWISCDVLRSQKSSCGSFQAKNCTLIKLTLYLLKFIKDCYIDYIFILS